VIGWNFIFIRSIFYPFLKQSPISFQIPLFAFGDNAGGTGQDKFIGFLISEFGVPNQLIPYIIRN
jgi:hypothetical protein